MFDLRTLKLMHPHDGDLVPYEEASGGGQHDSTEHDPERGWDRGHRIFRCPRCGNEVILAESVDDAAARS
jgi:hypothetical protein